MINYQARIRKMLANYEGTPLVLSYWDGKNDQFGKGRPRFTIHFKTEAALKRSLLETSLGFGEAYTRGDLVVDGDLVEALTALGEAYLAMEPERLLSRWARRAAARTLPREKADIEHHYGLGDEFYKFYLDKKLQYSCAYFRSTDDSLDLAQEQKIAHTVKKLYLQPGQRLLDIGCGWGHLMFHAAEVYGVECVGITLCDNQARYIRQEAARRQLPVEVRTINYLELEKDIKWERVVSIGMMEHVGESRADQFFDKVKSLLAPKAICLLHCISKMKEASGVDPFVEKHVFPGYWFFSLEGLVKRAVHRQLNVLDIENLRMHYALTLKHWRANFLRNYEEIKSVMKFDDRFMRTWEFYLASAEAGFHTGHLHLIQMVLTNGVRPDYPWTREFLYKAAPEYALAGG
ncbi:MAG TPA: cyclopropane-fatty-acyl-phospholipid synthase family protein [Candidatus Saccharimonadales bacterium]|nr:cyclopropane-fatty-acyl-phospholipid synthase family protein [Candidatus Saccharimonadales bacterium]